MVNEGAVLPIALEAARPFSVDDLLAAALARRGLSAGDMAAFCAPGPGTGEDYLEPLEILVASLENDAELTILGRWITHRFLDRLLDVRLQIAEYVRVDPGVREEQILEPIVVIGAPRTGTTVLHALLANDDRHRVPLGWELLRPVPPPVARRSRTSAPPERGGRSRVHPLLQRPEAQGMSLCDVARVPQ